MQVKLVQVN